MSQPGPDENAAERHGTHEDTGTSVSGAGPKVSSRLPSAEDPPPSSKADASSRAKTAEDDKPDD